MIAGLITKTSGEIIVSDKGKKIGNIGMVFQSPVLLPWTNVTNNVMLPVDIYGLDKASYRGRAQELIKFVGLDGFEGRYPHQLSGGMQQRVSLCRALITDPALLLMDEPFGALDALTREKMNLELLRIWSETKKTIVFVTHSIPEAVFLSNRIVVMTPRPGRVEKIVEDNLKRPRDIMTLQSPEFGTLCGDVRKLIGITSESSDLG
jgi:NitT/TauT family transport system ATP-binding protein